MLLNSDLGLAEYMVSGLDSENLRAISKLISPDFVFSSPRIKAYNFDQYCEHLDRLSTYFDVTLIKTEQKGDVFAIDLSVETVNVKNNIFKVDVIKALVVVTDHIVQSIEFVFEITEEEAARMDEMNPVDGEFRPD